MKRRKRRDLKEKSTWNVIIVINGLNNCIDGLIKIRFIVHDASILWCVDSFTEANAILHSLLAEQLLPMLLTISYKLHTINMKKKNFRSQIQFNFPTYLLYFQWLTLNINVFKSISIYNLGLTQNYKNNFM